MESRLPRSEIIRGRNEFRRIFNEGDRKKVADILSIAAPSDTRKAAFHVAKKTGGAVKRNRTKRLIREAYRLNKDLFPVNTAVIFAVYSPLSNESFESINLTIREIAEHVSANNR